MKILVTAGNTLVRLDMVRCLTNIFTGRTGAGIAEHAHERGHEVTLFTSHPEVVAKSDEHAARRAERWSLIRYSTFEELHMLMAGSIPVEPFDAVIHSAAVSDFLAGGVFAPAEGTHFEQDGGQWVSAASPPVMIDRQAGKIKSDEPELWLRLVRAPKLVDFIRTGWDFRGVLVKFKLEVGLDGEALLQVAERSRVHSAADLMVANSLQSVGEYAYLGPLDGTYQCVSRHELAARLLEAVEQLHEERRHG